MIRARQLYISVLLLLTPGLFIPSCQTNKGQLIPAVKVDIYLLLYADLGDVGIGGSKLISGGVNGIVLYRESDLEFFAYDRTCTMFPEHDEAVVEDPTFFGVFECPECKSTFLLMNGAEPNSGPARYPLVQYKASVQGDVLHIYN
ncbi:MAG: hypothetical protein R6W31_12345 [Bacteroidales bacterium]